MKAFFSRSKAAPSGTGLSAHLVTDPPSQSQSEVAPSSSKPAAFETEEDNSLNEPGISVKKPSMPLRNSVIVMEPSKRRKALGIFLVLAVSFVFMFCTPIYVIEKLNLIPPRPNFSGLKEKFLVYQNYTNETNIKLAAEMYVIYNRSVVEQQIDCKQRLEYVYNEESKVKNASSAFVNTYCKDVADRAYKTAYAVKNLTRTQINALPQCDLSYVLTKTRPSDYLHWTVRVDDVYPACSDAFVQNNISYCLVSLYLQKNPYACFDKYRWDNFYNLYTNVESSNTRCSTVQAQMQTKFQQTVEQKALGFKDSLNKRLDYDNNYFLGGAVRFGRITKYARNLQAEFPKIETSLEEFHTKIETNSKTMAVMYDIFKKALPADLENLFKLQPPDLSVPPYPTELVEEIKDIMEKMESISLGLKDYNPPEVVYPEVNNVFDFSPPNVDFHLADIEFQASTLLNDITETWGVLLRFVSAFQVTDFLIRFCLWLNDVAFILYEQRRDMTSLKTRARNYCALFLANMTILIYSILILVIAVIIAAQNVSISGVIRNETYVACNNEIVVKNSEILVDYQNDVAKFRTECNAGLVSENSKLAEVNTVFVDEFKSLYQPFERLFNATQSASTVTFTSLASPSARSAVVTLNLTGMYLPGNDLSRGVPVPLQKPTEIELYRVEPTVCTNSTEAAALADALDKAVNAFIDYVVAVLIVALGMIIAFRIFVTGLQFFFWMEITQGYMFDEEFTSTMLKSRIFSNRIKGIACMTISTVAVVIIISVYAKK